MLVATRLILFALMFVLASAVVFLCMVAVRSVLQRLISALSIHIPEAIRPLFDPSLPDVHVPIERSVWDTAGVVVITSLSGAVAIYLCVVLVEFWDLLGMM